jgi:hypothetical protein
VQLCVEPHVLKINPDPAVWVEGMSEEQTFRSEVGQGTPCPYKGRRLTKESRMKSSDLYNHGKYF